VRRLEVILPTLGHLSGSPAHGSKPLGAQVYPVLSRKLLPKVELSHRQECVTPRLFRGKEQTAVLHWARDYLLIYLLVRFNSLLPLLSIKPGFRLGKMGWHYSHPEVTAPVWNAIYWS